MYHAVGSTEAAVLTMVNNKVSYRNLHGDDPVLYNMYGTMASIVPLLGVDHTPQGVAIVRVDNLQMATGDDQFIALRAYQKLLAMSGQQVAAELAHMQADLKGIVDRIASEVKGAETIYYIHLIGQNRLFTGMSELSPKLPVTRERDSVGLKFIDSDESVVPLVGFENFSLPLRESPSQEALLARVAERQKEIAVHKEVRGARGEVENMSDEELQELLKLKQEGNKVKK